LRSHVAYDILFPACDARLRVRECSAARANREPDAGGARLVRPLRPRRLASEEAPRGGRVFREASVTQLYLCWRGPLLGALFHRSRECVARDSYTVGSAWLGADSNDQR
jgi:hypothetical protein